jgi:hypothetical protein
MLGLASPLLCKPSNIAVFYYYGLIIRIKIICFIFTVCEATFHLRGRKEIQLRTDAMISYLLVLLIADSDYKLPTSKKLNLNHPSLTKY